MLPRSLVKLHLAPTSPKKLQVSDYTFEIHRIKGNQHRTKRQLEFHTPAKLKWLYHPSKGSALIDVARGCLPRHHTDPSDR